MRPSWFIKVTLLACVAAAAAFGQQSTGTIVGTVTDPGGSVVPGATGTLTQVTTNGQRVETSVQNGEIRFEALVASTYKLEVSKQGFKALTIDGIELQSSETRDLGKIVLQIGALTESVEVTAEATPVQTASAERADSVTTAQIENITQKGRDPYGELHLLPGIIDTSTSRDLSNSYAAIASISINGLSGGSVSPSVDGATIQQMAGTSFTFVEPNLDAIEEVRVLANGYQAEYGRDGGGTINFITKSGTSKFHGTFHWDHRNEDLNANTFFNNRQAVPRAIYRYMILGGSIGGPLYIPKVMPQKLKNKFFFFYSPEYDTSKQPTSTVTVNEPTALERTGNFSQTFYAKAATAANPQAPFQPILVPITDPNTGVQFPGNIIPASRISAVGQGMLNLLQPATGYINPATPYADNASYSATPTFVRADNVARVDANVSKDVTAYFRMVRDIQNVETANAVTPGLGVYTINYPGGTYLAHVAWIIKPSLVNETMVEYGWTTQGSGPHNSPADSTLYESSALNPPRIVPYPTGKTVPWGYNEYPPFLPIQNYTGGNYANYSSWTPNPSDAFYKNGDHQYLWRDDITWTHGGHTTKAGVYWEHSSDFDEGGPGGNFTGTYNFGSAATNPFDTTDGYANALLGNFTQYSEASARAVQGRHYIATEWYVQDNWKITPRLTVDYGIRFMHNGSTQDDSKYTGQFLPSAYTSKNAPVLFVPACKVASASCSAANQEAIDPLNGTVWPSSAIAQIVPGTNAIDGIQYPIVHGLSYTAVQFQPRGGFAWNVFGDSKFVIRGGAAIQTQRPSLNNSMIGGYTAPVVYSNSVYNSNLADLATQAGNALITPVTGAVNAEIPLETVHEWNLTVERSVGFSTVVNAAYVGTFDRHAQETIPQNNIEFGAYALPANQFAGAEVNANLLRTQYPGIGTVSTYCGCLSTLNYNALQTSVKHRFTKGLTFNVNYQFSKGLGTAAMDAYHLGVPIPTAYGGTITLPNQRQYFYGPTATDRSQYAGFNFAYQLPAPASFGKMAKYFLGGWTLAGVTSFSTGAAVSPSCATSGVSFPANDPTWTGGTVRCEVVGNWKDYTSSFYSQFNTAAFAFPTGGTQANPQPNFGNTGLGIMRQPSWWNQDLTLNKVFTLGEKGRSLGINFQAYNVLNHTEFNAIGTAYTFNASGVNTNSTTGQYTAAQPNRQAVVTAKFIF